MALDILSTPGKSDIICEDFETGHINVILATSVDVERGFSRGGLTVSKLRHNLSDESTRAATVLNAWMKVPGLVSKTDMIAHFESKKSRTKNGHGIVADSSSEVIDIV